MSGDIATLGLMVDSRKVVTAGKDLTGFSNAAVHAEAAARKVTAANDNVALSAGRLSLGVNKAIGMLGGFTRGAIGAGAALFGVGALLKNFITNTIESEENLAQLNARLTSTKHAAGLTSGELVKLATDLQKLTTYEDDAIIRSEALMLSFRHIGRDVFPEAQKAVLDLATGMNQDLMGATLQLGKALDNPIEGLTALGRAGVKFNDAQKKSIETMVKTGDVAGAQTVILKELEVQFGGSARAARDTMGGALKALQNAWGNLFEVQGPGSKEMANSVERLTTKLEDPRTVESINAVGSALFSALTNSVGLITEFVDDIQKIQDEFNETKLSVETSLDDMEIAATLANATIVQVFTKSADYVVAAYNSAKDIVIMAWEQLPAAFQSLAARAGNYLIDGVEYGSQKAIGAVNSVIAAINAISPVAIPLFEMAPIERFKVGASKTFSELASEMKKTVADNFAQTPISSGVNKMFQDNIDGILKMREAYKITRDEQNKFDNMVNGTGKGNVRLPFSQLAVDPADNGDGGKAEMERIRKLRELEREREQARKEAERDRLEFQKKWSDAEFKMIDEAHERLRLLDEKKLEEIQGRMDETRSLAKDVFGGLVSDARAGASALDILGNAMTKIQDKILDMAENSFIDALFGKSGTSAPGAAGGIFSDFLSNIFGGVAGAGAGGGLYGDVRANGGPVSSGRSYMVGERGPERFTPSQSGMITPNNASAAPIVFKPEIVIPPGYQARTESVSDGSGGMKPRVIVEQIGAELGGNQKARRNMGLAPLKRSYA